MFKVNRCTVVLSSLIEAGAIIATTWYAFARTNHSVYPDGVKHTWLALGIIFSIIPIVVVMVCCCYFYKKAIKTEEDVKADKFIVAYHVVLMLLAAVKDIMLIVSLIMIPNESCGEDVVEDLLLAVKISGSLAFLVSLPHHLKFRYYFIKSSCHILIYGAHLLPQLLSLTVLIYSLAHPCNVKATSCSTDIINVTMLLNGI